MKKLIGGALALVLGIFLFSCFPYALVKFCLGVIPVILIFAGSIAVYISYVNLSDELSCGQEKQAKKMEESAQLKKAIQENVLPPASEPEKNSVQPVFLGNTQSLIFHHPECNFAQSKKCTQPFFDKESALLAGYSPCGVCEP